MAMPKVSWGRSALLLGAGCVPPGASHSQRFARGVGNGNQRRPELPPAGRGSWRQGGARSGA